MKFPILIIMLIVFPADLLGQVFGLDTTFEVSFPFVTGTNSQYIGGINDLIEEDNGNVTIVGSFREGFSSNRGNFLRLYANGHTDLSFFPDFFNPDASYVSVEKVNGHYYVNNGNFNVFKFSNTGTLIYQDFIPRDTNFGGLTRTPYVFPDGSMLVGGDGSKFPSPNNFQKRLYFMRILPSGYVDTSFHHNTEFDIRNVIRYDESRLLLYGNQLVLYDSVSVNKLCLIDTLGNLDTIFRPDLFSWGITKPLHVQDNGKVILGGTFTINNYPDTLHIIRLNIDGSLDSTFNNFNTINGWTDIYSVCPTTDGGYLIGGIFNEYQGYARHNIVKTDKDGFVDSRFFNEEGIDSSRTHWNYPAWVTSIIPAQNDKYYVAGHFLKYNGVVVKPIIRILGMSHTVPLEEEAAKSQLQVIPNPANKQALFRWTLSLNVQAFQLRIMDQKGRLVREEELASFDSQWTWHTHSVTDGLYFYELRSTEGELMTQGKLIIRK